MEEISIFRRHEHETKAKEFLTATLVSNEGYQVTLDIPVWIPLDAPGISYFLDAGQPDTPADSVTYVKFSSESQTGPPFRVTGTLYPQLTSKKHAAEGCAAG